MIEQKFIDKIEDLRHHTYSRITNIQKNLCPMVKNIHLTETYEYWYDGYKYNVWENNVRLYNSTEVPYCYDNEIKNTVFTDTLTNLIDQDKIFPFLMFIDGRVIKWSNISIIHDYEHDYIRLENIPYEYSSNALIVIFPMPSKQIRYGEDSDILVSPNRKGFYFGTDGKRLENTDIANISLRLEILDENIYYKEINIGTISNTLIFDELPDGYIPTLDNILTFSSDGSYNMLGPNQKFEDIYNSTYGMFNILQNEYDVKWAILVYKLSESKSNSFLYSKAEDLNRDSIVKLLLETPKDSDAWREIIEPLITKFDFDHQFGEKYETNISNATKYITRYDFKLFKDSFTSTINIKSLTYTGEQFKDLSDEFGYVNYSRVNKDLVQNVILMFINHKIYEHMENITYETNTIKISISDDIQDDDHIEILMFTKSNNNILDITVPDEDTEVYIYSEYNLDDCYFMTDQCLDLVYDVTPDPSGKTQYKIEDYTYDRISEGKYKIHFGNPGYYGKPLKLVPKNQFRHCKFDDIEDQYKFTLPDDFNYCHDEDQYLVFVNGVKIARTEYTVTIMNEDRPFNKIELYVSALGESGDYIDVFYIPEKIAEKYRQNEISEDGLLLLEDTEESINYPTTYPLSKYTSMVFINGMKVNPLDIKDVSLNAMLINVDKYIRDESGDPIGINTSRVDSIQNITIAEIVEGNKEVAGYLKGLYEQIPEGQEYNPENINFYKPASDLWKEIINTLIEKYSEESDHAGLQKIFGSIFNITDPAPDYRVDYLELRSILYDIVLEHYLRNSVTTGDRFVFDYDREHFDPKVIPDTKDIVKEINIYQDKDKFFDYDFDE